MSVSPPRKKTFPTLQSTSPPRPIADNITPIRTSPSYSLRRESLNSSPPTVPYTIEDMNAGVNHIITKAMVCEQLNQSNTATSTAAAIIGHASSAAPHSNNTTMTTTQYQSPSKRLLQGLSLVASTTTCDGSYGQNILQDDNHGNSGIILSNIFESSVPVEDVLRWKEFRRKQKTSLTFTSTSTTAISTPSDTAVVPTTIDANGFPLSSSDDFPIAATTMITHNHNEDIDITISIHEQQQQQLSSKTNSDVGTEIVSNTARYLANQSNIMARRLIDGEAKGGGGDGNNYRSNEDDCDDDEWGPPMDIGVHEDEQMVMEGSYNETTSTTSTFEGNGGDVHDAGTISPKSLLSKEADLPTMDEVYDFINQLKHHSASRERRNKHSNNHNSDGRFSSPSIPKSTRCSSSVQPTAIERSNTKPINLSTAATSSLDAQKSLVEHRERMRQQKLEGQRKRQEFDARLRLLRSKLNGGDSKSYGNEEEDEEEEEEDDDDGGVIVAPIIEEDLVSAPPIIEQGDEKEVVENNQPASIPLPGARWSGGLAVWSPSNSGVVGAKRSKSTPPKLSSPSRRTDDDLPLPKSHHHHHQQQQQQQQHHQSTPSQLLPPLEIGIDEDDFSFCPVDLDAVSLHSHSSSSTPKEVKQLSSSSSTTSIGKELGTPPIRQHCLEFRETFTVAKSPSVEAHEDETVEEEGSGLDVEPESMIFKSTLVSPHSEASLPVSNVSTDITEGDKGGGLGSGYVRDIGEKSTASSVNVELGFNEEDDPPLGDESSEKEEILLGVTVVGSKKKKKKRKSNSSRTLCETVEEHSKKNCNEGDESVAHMKGKEEEHERRDPSPVSFEPMPNDAPPLRKPLDPDGIDWKDIDAVKLEAHITVPTKSSCTEEKVFDTDEIENVQLCPDNNLSPRNKNLPPFTTRMALSDTVEGQWNPNNHFTSRSKLLTNQRATPRTARATNLSSYRRFGFGVKADSPDTSFKMNERPFIPRDVNEVSDELSKGNLNVDTPRSNYLLSRDFTPKSNRLLELDEDIDSIQANSLKHIAKSEEKEVEQIDNKSEGKSSTSFNRHSISTFTQLQNKFESNTFGIDHLQMTLQKMREEAVENSKSPLVPQVLGGSNTPSRIYLMDRELRAMSSLETDTQVSVDNSLSKGMSHDNDETIGDSTLGDGTMDTKKVLRYAKRLQKLNENEDRSKENHDEEVSFSLVAQRRKAFENPNESIRSCTADFQSKVETADSQTENGFLASQRSLFSASKRNSTSAVSSIKERIAAYDSQNTKNGKPSPYRLPIQGKTFQIRVGGEVKNVSTQNSARRRSMNDAVSLENSNWVVGKAALPSWATNRSNKQLSPAPAGNNRDANNVGAQKYYKIYSSMNERSSDRSESAGSQNHPMTSRVTPIDTKFESPMQNDDDDDGITLSPTLSEVSGLTLPTFAGVVPVLRKEVPVLNGAKKYERVMTPIGRLRQEINQAKSSSYYPLTGSDTAVAPAQRLVANNSQIHQRGPSRRDQIVSRIRDKSSNGNLWQRRNIINEVTYSTSGEASNKSQNASVGYTNAAAEGTVTDNKANLKPCRPTEVNESGERVSVGSRVATMNRLSQQQHKTMPSKGSKTNEQSSSISTRDCLRVD